MEGLAGKNGKLGKMPLKKRSPRPNPTHHHHTHTLIRFPCPGEADVEHERLEPEQKGPWRVKERRGPRAQNRRKRPRSQAGGGSAGRRQEASRAEEAAQKQERVGLGFPLKWESDPGAPRQKTKKKTGALKRTV